MRLLYVGQVLVFSVVQVLPEYYLGAKGCYEAYHKESEVHHDERIEMQSVANHIQKRIDYIGAIELT